jgi:hypothetical protein
LIGYCSDPSIAAFARQQEQYRAELGGGEADRHAREVKLLASLSSNDERARYIEGENGVRAIRGDRAADRLRRDVWAMMKAAAQQVEPLQESLL